MAPDEILKQKLIALLRHKKSESSCTIGDIVDGIDNLGYARGTVSEHVGNMMNTNFNFLPRTPFMGNDLKRLRLVSEVLSFFNVDNDNEVVLMLKEVYWDYFRYPLKRKRREVSCKLKVNSRRLDDMLNVMGRKNPDEWDLDGLKHVMECGECWNAFAKICCEHDHILRKLVAVAFLNGKFVKDKFEIFKLL